MRKLLMLATVTALLVPMRSRAQLTFGLRLGYARSMGKAYAYPAGAPLAGASMDGFALEQQVPVQLDALYRVTPDLALGVYAGFGLGNTPETGGLSGLCISRECTGSDLRLGVEGIYTFRMLSSQFVPWVGVGTGWERLGMSPHSVPGFTLNLGSEDYTYSGIEFFNIQVGGDYALNEKFALGPYLLFALAQYSRDSTPLSSGALPTKSLHEWMSIGLRAKFDL